MKVVHAIPSMAERTGGPAFAVAALCSALGRNGLKVDLVTTDLGVPANAKKSTKLVLERDLPPIEDSVNVHIAPVRWFQQWAFAPSMNDLLAQVGLDADIIHIHSLNLHTQYASWRFAVKQSIPYVLTPHGALAPYIRARNSGRKRLIDRMWQARMLQNASTLHVTSEDEQLHILQFAPGVHQTLLPFGVNLDTDLFQIQSGEFRNAYLGGFSGPLIMNHGRISPVKGLCDSIDALSILREGGLDARLALIGPDDVGHGKELLLLASKRGVAGSVFLTGPLRGAALHQALVDGDVWVLPSRSESFGLAVVEAMAAGKPVVTSPQVNVAQGAATTDALVTVENDPALIATEIYRILTDTEWRTRLSLRAREYAERFDWKELGPQYIAMYNHAIEQHLPRSH